MSRHNRRRTRGSQKTPGIPLQQRTFDIPPDLGSAPLDPLSLAFPGPAMSRRGGVSARHWHNRYMAWQVRERRQREEREKLEAEKRRIFGGEVEGGEDEGLCIKMMEYFGGLDFIEE
ncbi:hypothetical protein MMC34_000588 [Xylographa carneopallida]|nr:hypothetical protein [Xylographa carneopallida]